MQDAARFLGFAFANADLLLEVDKMGKVSFAVGAATEFGGDDKMTGSALGRLFEPSESAKSSTHLHALGPAGAADLCVCGWPAERKPMCRFSVCLKMADAFPVR